MKEKYIELEAAKAAIDMRMDMHGSLSIEQIHDILDSLAVPVEDGVIVKILRDVEAAWDTGEIYPLKLAKAFAEYHHLKELAALRKPVDRKAVGEIVADNAVLYDDEINLITDAIMELIGKAKPGVAG